jgi:hypothetical protein
MKTRDTSTTEIESNNALKQQGRLCLSYRCILDGSVTGFVGFERTHTNLGKKIARQVKG